MEIYLSTAQIENPDLDVMEKCKDDSKGKVAGRVGSDSYQNDGLILLGDKDRVDNDEYKAQDSVPDDPPANEADFIVIVLLLLEEVLVLLIFVARAADLGSPADIVDITKGVDDEGVGVGGLVVKVGEQGAGVYHFADLLGVGENMHEEGDEDAGEVYDDEVHDELSGGEAWLAQGFAEDVVQEDEGDHYEDEEEVVEAQDGAHHLVEFWRFV